MTKLVKRNNVVYRISEDELKNYIKNGYVELDKNGNEIKTEAVKAVKKEKELTAKVAELEATITELTSEKEELAKVKEELTAKVAELEATTKKNSKKEE